MDLSIEDVDENTETSTCGRLHGQGRFADGGLASQEGRLGRYSGGHGEQKS